MFNSSCVRHINIPGGQKMKNKNKINDTVKNETSQLLSNVWFDLHLWSNITILELKQLFNWCEEIICQSLEKL